jgi:prepilin-type N-terminal cleavage/methylation domain-containing protein
MKGFTFIEILISLMLLSLLLISIDATQLTALRETETAYDFSAAVNQIQNLKAQLAAGIDPQTLAAWNVQNANILPSGAGTFSNNKIAVFWGEYKTLTCEKIELGPSGCVFENIDTEASLS